MSYCFLEAFERVPLAKRQAYEKLSYDNDRVIKETEPGHLVHVHTIVAESGDSLLYRWLEIYRSAEDLLAHLENPKIKDHIKILARDKLIVGKPQVVIYCDWSEEQKRPFLEIAAVDLSFAEIVTGYFR